MPGPCLFDPDSYYWLNYAHRMANEGRCRIRWTMLDNVPYGREVHWSSSIAWWLVLGGSVVSQFSGCSLSDGIDIFAPWANPVLLAIVGLILIGVIWRTLGLWSSAGFACVWLTAPSVLWDYGYGLVDHHGLHDFAVILACGPALIAYRPGSHRIVALGIFSGIGLGLGVWVGATTEYVVAVGFFAGGAAMHVIAAIRAIVERRSYESDTRARFWLASGLSGGAVSLALFLVEYAGYLDGAMRMEVNSPIYAIALLGGGALVWTVNRVFAWFFGKGQSAMAALAITIVSGAGVASPLLAFVRGPAEWHAMRDSVLSRIHQQGTLNSPIFQTTGYAGDPLVEMAVPIAFAFAAILVGGSACWGRGVGCRISSGLLACAVPALILAVLTAGFHLRWAGMFVSVAALCVAGLFAWQNQSDNRFALRHVLLSAIAAGALVCGAVGAISNQARVTSEFVRNRAGRDIAAYLLSEHLKSATAQPRVAAVRYLAYEPALLPIWFGIPVLGSRYWENTDGLRSESELFGTSDALVAARIVRERGLTHLIVLSDEGSVMLHSYLWSGGRDPLRARATFLARLVSGSTVPEWLSYEKAFSEALPGAFSFRVFRVVADKLPNR